MKHEPQTAHGAAIAIIRDELSKRNLPITKINRMTVEMCEKYTSDDIIRVADAIQRFGLDALCAAI